MKCVISDSSFFATIACVFARSESTVARLNNLDVLPTFVCVLAISGSTVSRLNNPDVLFLISFCWHRMIKLVILKKNAAFYITVRTCCIRCNPNRVWFENVHCLVLGGWCFLMADIEMKIRCLQRHLKQFEFTNGSLAYCSDSKRGWRIWKHFRAGVHGCILWYCVSLTRLPVVYLRCNIQVAHSSAFTFAWSAFSLSMQQLEQYHVVLFHTFLFLIHVSSMFILIMKIMSLKFCFFFFFFFFNILRYLYVYTVCVSACFSAECSMQ